MSYERAVIRELGDDDSMAVPWRDDGITLAMIWAEYRWDKHDVLVWEQKRRMWRAACWAMIVATTGLLILLLAVSIA